MKLTVDFFKNTGAVKPMHAVNNGPMAPNVRGTSNHELYASLGIPYARNHDASFFTGYGGEHTVDVHRIFKNFAADENDPASYTFAPTDQYVKDTFGVGTKVYYRLGASIEHDFKEGTYPPADFHKWARICEHIIAHYTEGWADGFRYDIEYWEIWNEPDCRNADGSNPCWQGTDEEFLEFFTIAFKHLKARFPHLKIGGPAICSPQEGGYAENFLAGVQHLPLDFFSWHCYAKEVWKIKEKIERTHRLMKRYGFENIESILNEWNYVKGWFGDGWKASIDAWKGLKGSAFIAGAMCVGQYAPVDMLMFYEARPCGMCALFETDRPWNALKGAYPFKMFSEIYKMDSSVAVETDDEQIYAVAAKKEGAAAMMLTYFEDETDIRSKAVDIDLLHLGFDGRVSVYLLDEEHDCEKVAQLSTAEPLHLTVGLYHTYLLVMEKED